MEFSQHSHTVEELPSNDTRLCSYEAKRKRFGGIFSSHFFTQSLTATHARAITNTSNRATNTLSEKYEIFFQSFAVFGYHMFAFSFSFAKKGIFVLKSG